MYGTYTNRANHKSTNLQHTRQGRLQLSQLNNNTAEQEKTSGQISTDLWHRRTAVPEESLPFGHLVSRELLKLSVEDRTAIHEEIHGVCCLAITETPELFARALSDFQTELNRMPPSQKQTYELCRARATQYQDEEHSCYALHDIDFRLRFLRAELFDAAKAAVRFANYLDFVKTYWGTEIALNRLIRLSDFTKDEIKLFRKGYFQVLPFRDRSGRRVITLLGGVGSDVDPHVRSKILFYFLDVLSRTDVETQRKGFIVVSEAYCFCANLVEKAQRSNTSLKFPNPQEAFHYVKHLMTSIPFRLIAMHHCWPDRRAFHMLAKLLTIYGVVGSNQKLRLKFHIGDEMEMRYRLKSFGIPIELLPITETGTIKIANHKCWIKIRKTMENGCDTDATIIECPGINDVVFRQGTPSNGNPGNDLCRHLILELLEGKEPVEPWASSSPDSVATRTNTQNIAVHRLLDIVINYYGGRFLEWDRFRNTWIQMRDSAKIKRKATFLVHSVINRHNPAVAVSGSLNRSVSMGRDLVTMKIAPPTLEHEHEHEPYGEQGNYEFVEGGRLAAKQQNCCHQLAGTSSENSRKRRRK
eukprot:jgi/Psemu1/398/gm1.398_g